MSDSELARRCAEGDASAWDDLVRGHLDLVYRAVRRVLASPSSAASEADIEDVTQTVFVKLLEDGCRRLRSFQGRSKLSTWLVAVARRECLDFLDKRKRADRKVLSAPFIPGPVRLAAELEGDPGVGVGAPDTQRIEVALSRLPTRDHILVRLVYMDGASYEEAARFLAVPVNSISPWLGRARDRLKALLEDGRAGRPQAV